MRQTWVMWPLLEGGLGSVPLKPFGLKLRKGRFRKEKTVLLTRVVREWMPEGKNDTHLLQHTQLFVGL